MVDGAGYQVLPASTQLLTRSEAVNSIGVWAFLFQRSQVKQPAYFTTATAVPIQKNKRTFEPLFYTEDMLEGKDVTNERMSVPAVLRQFKIYEAVPTGSN